MSKKTGLQVVMVLIIILISLWFYLKYFTKNFEDVRETRAIEKIDENQNNTKKKTVGILHIHNILQSNIH